MEKHLDKTADKITIERLDLFYGSFQAIKSIDMHIPPREITAFIGPSGCGKSTLLKTLNRMNDLVEGCRIKGRVLLDGEDAVVKRYARVERRLRCNAELADG